MTKNIDLAAKIASQDLPKVISLFAEGTKRGDKGQNMLILRNGHVNFIKDFWPYL